MIVPYLLIVALDEVCRRVKSEVPHINSGGCGVFAVSIAEMLKLIGYEPQMYLYLYRVDVPIFNRWHQRNTATGIINDSPDFCLCHVITEIMDGNVRTVIDADDGVLSVDSYTKVFDAACPYLTKVDVPLDHEAIRACVKNERMWNSKFSRNHIETVRSIIKQVFSRQYPHVDFSVDLR